MAYQIAKDFRGFKNFGSFFYGDSLNGDLATRLRKASAKQGWQVGLGGLKGLRGFGFDRTRMNRFSSEFA